MQFAAIAYSGSLILESLTSLPQNVLQALVTFFELARKHRKDSYTIVVTKQFAKTLILFLTVYRSCVTYIHVADIYLE